MVKEKKATEYQEMNNDEYRSQIYKILNNNNDNRILRKIFIYADRLLNEKGIE